MVVYRIDQDHSEFLDWHNALANYQWIHGGPVIRHLVAICRLARQALPGHTEATEERLYGLVEAVRSKGAPTAPRGNPIWLTSVREHIHAHFTAPIDVRNLAVMAGTHPVYLARIFRRQYGLSVTQYVRRLRTKHAATLLTSTSAPIANVALAAGFADHAHLCRVFRSEMGVTPGAFRRLAGD